MQALCAGQVQGSEHMNTLQDIVSYRSGLYFLPTGNAAPNALPGSFVTFTLNGVSQGVAYRCVQVLLHTCTCQSHD